MSAESLPTFRYHPDPVTTGSLTTSDRACRCCGRKRGYIYTGPVYAEEELENALCPWCIADGSAHEKFSAEFTDAASVGDQGEWPAVDDGIVETVSWQTPGFSGWQQERWFTCCDDAGAFLGPMGRADLEKLGAEAIAVIREESGYPDGEWEEYFTDLNRDFGPTAYLFRCLHCGRLGGYSDFA